MQASTERDLLWIEREAAYINVKFRLLQLKLAVELERHAFNPNQPRDEIGRWADGGGSTDRKPIDSVQVAQNGPGLPSGGYRIDLREEEALGGHPITRHIGESEQSLLSKLREEIRYAKEKGDKFEDFRLGAFSSVEAANKLVNSALAQNPLLVDQVANGAVERHFLSARFSAPTGFEAFASNERSKPYIRDTYGVSVVIRRDPSSQKGFRIQTAYPQY